MRGRAGATYEEIARAVAARVDGAGRNAASDDHFSHLRRYAFDALLGRRDHRRVKSGYALDASVNCAPLCGCPGSHGRCGSYRHMALMPSAGTRTAARLVALIATN